MSAPAEDSAQVTDAVGRLVAMLRPGSALEVLTGTAESVEMVIAAARGDILVEVAALVATEAAHPRPHPQHEPGMWVTSEGFYMALMGERLEQLLESVQAMLVLHRAGHYRPAWGLLQQATMTLHRLWMLTDAPVDDQPRDEARRSGKEWLVATAALTHVDGVTGFGPHPFDTAYLGDEGQSEQADLAGALAGGHRQWLPLWTALTRTVRLAEVYVPGHLQMEPDAASTMATLGTGFSSPAMVRAQCELAVALVHAAATAARGGLEISLDGRGL